MQCNYNNVKYIEHLEMIFETHHMKTEKNREITQSTDIY